MTGGRFRNPHGGEIDRSLPVSFSWAGRSLQGYVGDTLASALVANGVRVAGRSFKYHRPRGIVGSGVDETNVLVDVGEGARRTPNQRATEVELQDRLEARPVNCWPNARFDVGAINSLLSPFFPAGFYYKTFKWPTWHAYEWAIRRAAGLGRASDRPDPDLYDHRYAHCDVLVVGSGPSGMAAALAASAGGARVILVEQDRRLGGSLLSEGGEIDGLPAEHWVAEAEQELRNLPELRILTRTTATGYFDNNWVSLIERSADEFVPQGPAGFRQRLWEVRARYVILATGAIERPLLFADNDRPGVVLTGAARSYAARYAARMGDRAVVTTNNDRGHEHALALKEMGIAIEAVVDSRAQLDRELVERLASADIRLIECGRVTRALGGSSVRGVRVEAGGVTTELPCDLAAMSGGYNPSVHLFSQSGGTLNYDENLACFVPASSPQPVSVVGAAGGVFDGGRAFEQGHQAGRQAAERCGFACTRTMSRTSTAPAYAIDPVWHMPSGGKAFVDYQHDVTCADIALAARENFRSVEHLKRYTTLGMACDQGKLSNVNAIAVMANLTDRTIPEVGTTRYRPPFTPVTLSAFAGRERGHARNPMLRLPCHEQESAHGAVFEDHGVWQRAVYFAPGGEARETAIAREAETVRTRVGLLDYSSLGKIHVQGPDAGRFLDLIYANSMLGLKPGKLRYGLMLSELGVVLDDGIVARLGPDHFLITTTSAHSSTITGWLEEWLQCEWLDLEVLVTPVTTTYANLLLSGPVAPQVLERAGTDLDLGAEAFPHMSVREGTVAGVAARVFRASFTGEVSFEINVERHRAGHVWEALMSAGAELGIQPFGLEALLRLRAEKGFIIVGQDTDGATVPADIGWGHVTKREVDFVGKRSLTLPENMRDERLQFVGLKSIDGKRLPEIGAHLAFAARSTKGSDGFVTWSHVQAQSGEPVILALINGGRARIGESIGVIDTGQQLALIEPGIYDPQGERLRG